MRNPAARRGVSPLEVLIVVLVASILLGAVVPTARGMLDTLAVRGAAQRIAAAHTLARVTAVLESRTALLTVRHDSLVIRVVVGTDTVVRWAEGGPASEGISVSGPVRPMQFSPVGIMVGVTNGTWRVARGGASRRVVVSRLGRLRILP